MAQELRLDKLGAKRSDLEQASHDRLADAVSLLADNRYASAIAMGLYSLEICLKLKICHRLDLEALPTPFEFHNPEALLVLSGLSRKLREDKVQRVKANWDQVTAKGDSHVNDLRYLPAVRWTQREAEEVLLCLRDEEDGVLTWLFKQE